MRQELLWVGRSAIWIVWKPRKLWVFLITIPIVIWLFLFLPISKQESIRVSGAFFQLLGLVTIFLNLNGRRQLFGIPGLVKRMRVYWAERPRLRPVHKFIKLSGGISSASNLSADVTVWKGMGQEKNLSDRVSALVENLTTLKNLHEKQITRINESIQKLRKAADEEIIAHRQGIQAIEGRLKNFATGTLRIELLGAIWLLIGIVLSGIPTLISRIF